MFTVKKLLIDKKIDTAGRIGCLPLVGILTFTERAGREKPEPGIRYRLKCAPLPGLGP